MSRSASASQRARPRIACWRYGPLSPAASARIQPVLRRSGPSRPSRNAFAEAAIRSCVNNGRIRPLTARSDEAHRSNVVSSDATLIHLPSQPRWKVGIKRENRNCSVNSFVQSYGSKELDASLLLLPLVGFLPADDARIQGTVLAIEKHLLRDG